MSARKKSSVWTFYTETDQPNKVKCILCDSLISRGGSGRSASTSALTNHLRVKHDREYTQLQHPIHLPNPILPSVRPSSSNTTEEAHLKVSEWGRRNLVRLSPNLPTTSSNLDSIQRPAVRIYDLKLSDGLEPLSVGRDVKGVTCDI
ncbi:unnamed protein product [Euphydryas editha]|uniref:BED-type domain-containing protein n=1 Tax=Euphydryas editha TaxID=104508 RepID=A0AAU9V647_EUPED|nr:unnamed protein product [Euphydryas editha]